MLIPLKHKTYGNYMMEIDEEDWDKIKHLNLTINGTSNKNTKYCKSTIYKNCKYVKKLHIHRVIMGLGDYNNDKRVINHIDGNGLNNKKSNLEICSILYNSQSINRPNGNKGLIYLEKNTAKTKRLKKYRFVMKVNKKRHSKRFLTMEEAEEYQKNFILDLLK